MSDLGAVAQVYNRWNEVLSNVNEWLLTVRKVRDGILPSQTEVEIPQDVFSTLRDIGRTLYSPDDKTIAPIPLTIKHKLNRRLRDEAEDFGLLLLSLKQNKMIRPMDLTTTDIEHFRILVSCLDDEVTTLYNRMRRRR